MTRKLILFILLAAVCYGQAQPGVRMAVCNDAGANDTYTCSASPAVTSYTNLKVLLTVNTANTGIASLNIDSVGAKTIHKIAGGIITALEDNDLVPKGTYLLVYNSTDDDFKVITATGTAGSGASGSVSGTSGALACFDSTTSVGDCIVGLGITVAGGTAAIDRAVLPTKAVSAGVPTMAGQLTGDFAVDTSASPDVVYFCGADDGTDCTAVIRLGSYAEMLPLAGGTLTGQLITDNLGIEFAESDTNPACASGNYNVYADASESKLKACQNGVASDLLGSSSSAPVLAAGVYASGMAQSATRYHTLGAETVDANEVNRQVRLRAGTIRNLYVNLFAAVGGSGQSITITVRKNGVSGTSTGDTAVTCSIASGASTCEDTTNSVTWDAGDKLSFEYTTTGTTGTLYPIVSVSFE